MAHTPSSLKVKTPLYTFNIKGLHLGKDSEITTRMGYAVSHPLASHILAWDIQEKKARENGISIEIYYEPSPLSSDAHKEQWRDIQERKGQFNGQVQTSHGVHVFNTLLTPSFSVPFWTSQGAKPMDSILVATCFAENSKGKQWPKKICSQVKKDFRLTPAQKRKVGRTPP